MLVTTHIDHSCVCVVQLEEEDAMMPTATRRAILDIIATPSTLIVLCVLALLISCTGLHELLRLVA